MQFLKKVSEKSQGNILTNSAKISKDMPGDISGRTVLLKGQFKKTILIGIFDGII